MTITWSKGGRANLEEFGISIPLLASRSEQVLTYLRQVAPRHFADSQVFRELNATPIKIEAMKLAHSSDYVDDICGANGAQKIAECYELYDASGRPNRYDPEAAKRPLHELTNYQRQEADLTLQTAHLALDRGFAYFLGGGMHHASRDHGRGFCLINDIVIAARSLQKEGAIKTVWVIDNDAHKGDGTASLCRFDDSIITLSIHMARGWPLDEPRTLRDGTPNPAYAASDIDIGIESGDESHYNDLLQAGLMNLKTQFVRPDFAIVVNGSDPYIGDTLPSTRPLQLTLQQMLERDRLVHSFLTEQKIPQLWLMAGGYGPDVWRVHAQFLEYLLAEKSPQ